MSSFVKRIVGLGREPRFHAIAAFRGLSPQSLQTRAVFALGVNLVLHLVEVASDLSSVIFVGLAHDGSGLAGRPAGVGDTPASSLV
jgi:hypothetical protein